MKLMNAGYFTSEILLTFQKGLLFRVGLGCNVRNIIKNIIDHIRLSILIYFMKYDNNL